MRKSRYEFVSPANYFYLSVIRIWAGITAQFFFRRFKTTGQDRIPMDVPVIFCANHQSAFLDPVLIGITCGRKPWYITRAGVFTTPLVKFLLNSLHMLPIFRPRDKVNILEANADTFDECEKILRGGGSLVVFVEGNHDMRNRLRVPLRKGFARMALNASTENQPVWIVPVGLTYEDPVHPRSDLLIQYGEAFSVGEFVPEFAEKKADALSRLTRRLEVSLKPLVLDINDKDNYDNIEMVWQTARKPSHDLLKRFTDDQARISQLCEGGAEESPQQDESGFLKSVILRLLSIPVIVSGLVVNLPLILLTKFLVARVVKDPHFDQSIKFVCVMGGAILFGLINYLLFYFLSGDALASGITALAAPVLGILAYDLYSDLWRREGYVPSAVRMKMRTKKGR